MNKKRNLLVKTIISLTVALILCLGTAMPVFASGEPTPELIPPAMVGTETNPAKAGITKFLRMPVGTSVPNVVFEFDVVGEADTDAPVILASPFKLTFAAADEHCMTDGDDILIMHHATGDIFNGVTFPHAGSYVYYVTERTTKTDGGAPIYVTPQGVTYSDEMILSQAVYKLIVYVANKADGTTYISGIGATKEVDHDGEPSEDTGKLDVTPYPEGDHDGDHKYSQMIFQNDYIKYPGNGDGGDPETDEGTALKISKLVKGPYADKTLPFVFTVSVDKPGLVSESEDAPVCKVFLMGTVGSAVANLTNANLILDAAGDPVTIKTDGTQGPYFEFEPGSTFKAKLADGQWLAVTGLSTGAKVNVAEAATAEYKPSYEAMFNGATALAGFAENFGDALSITDENNFTGENTNSVQFTNTHQNISQTGISVDNLPFVIMIVIGALALVAYIVIKLRRNAKNNV